MSQTTRAILLCTALLLACTVRPLGETASDGTGTTGTTTSATGTGTAGTDPVTSAWETDHGPTTLIRRARDLQLDLAGPERRDRLPQRRHHTEG